MRGCSCRNGELVGKDVTPDVVGSFVAQEEVGLRGESVAVKTVKPDVSIVFEGSPADDTLNSSGFSQTSLKKGPMLRHIDGKMIANPRFQRFTLDIAQELNIPVQEAVRFSGSTNGAVINISEQGIPVIVIGIPVRYIHTHCGYASYEDFENTVKLGLALIERLTEERISSF